MARPLTFDLGVPSFLSKIFEAKPAGLALKDALCIIRGLGAWKWRLRELAGLVAALHASIERSTALSEKGLRCLLLLPLCHRHSGLGTQSYGSAFPKSLQTCLNFEDRSHN
jgi:hypothetical protein